MEIKIPIHTNIMYAYVMENVYLHYDNRRIGRIVKIESDNEKCVATAKIYKRYEKLIKENINQF